MTAPPLRSIDLNADLGEHEGDRYGHDESILDHVTSASIACGGHAGSRKVMSRTVAAARDRGVAVGAHPGYPDREGFGRRHLALTHREIGESVRRQIELLAECCASAEVRLRYVKLHGALYNRAATDAELAGSLAECIASINPALAVLAPARSAMETQAIEAGLVVAREGFIDRAYLPTGALVPRSSEGAIMNDPEAAADRAVSMARDGRVRAIDGIWIDVSPASLCVHGDSPDALLLIQLARKRLEESGFSIEPFVL